MPGQEMLDQAFPFHLRVDGDLVVRAFGRSTARLCAGIAEGDHLTDHLILSSPRGVLSRDHLIANRRRPVVFTTIASRTPLRCQVTTPAGDDGDVVLLATPWLSSPDDLARLGLTLDHFAPHDPSTDYMFLVQSQKVSLADSKRLAERLGALEAARRHEANHDALTGVGNRRSFTACLATADASTCLVLVDVDLFKEINDTYGHDTGDAVLTVLATRLRHIAPFGSQVFRLGGDEFGVLLSGPDSERRAEALAQQALEAMREPVDHADRTVKVTLSIGVAAHGDPTLLTRNADVAMYSAKRAGRAQSVTFRPSLHETLLHRIEMRDRLGEAIRDGGVTLAYQPIVTLATGRIHGFEALARWRDPTWGPVPPDVFIPLAEEVGLIGELGRHVLREGADQLAQWRRQHPASSLTMSINLAPRQLEEPTLCDDVQAVLDQGDLPPEVLQLELTESAFTSQQQSTEQLHRLRAMGLPLAIDDFGSSESTLARLHTVPATVLKIDRAFLLELEHAPERSTRLLHAVVGIAEALGMTTVAEGIETQEQLDVVVAAGCTHGQGYFFAKPMDPATAEQYLARTLAAEALHPAVPHPRGRTAPISAS